MTPWSFKEFYDFIDWHEVTISQYPQTIQDQLRKDRTKFLSGLKVFSATDCIGGVRPVIPPNGGILTVKPRYTYGNPSKLCRT